MMIVKDEADRHLPRAIETALTIIGDEGILRITDDGSTDNTVSELRDLTKGTNTEIRSTEAKFWTHEGSARQDHYDWATKDLSEGDWILSIDADESINKPSLLPLLVSDAQANNKFWVGLPLYEFWTETEHRVDGFWFGSVTRRLFKWVPGGMIKPVEMACGSEPFHVWRLPGLLQGEAHLLHWGYLRPEDRTRKFFNYTSRLGGHGHNNQHVQSIIGTPTLREYQAW